MVSIGQELTSKKIKQIENGYTQYLLDNRRFPKKLLIVVPSISSQGKYKVTSISDPEYIELMEIKKNSTTRPELSRFGQSHDNKVSISDLKIHKGFRGNVLNPEILVFDDGKLVSQFQNSESLFIVENKEVFYAQEFLTNEVFVKYPSVDVVFGEGKYVQNSNFSDFFKSYENIIYFPDFDLEGLRIAYAMQARYNCTIFIPECIEDAFRKSEFYVKNNKELGDLINISLQISVLLAKMFKAYRTKIEQEMFVA